MTIDLLHIHQFIAIKSCTYRVLNEQVDCRQLLSSLTILFFTVSVQKTGVGAVTNLPSNAIFNSSFADWASLAKLIVDDDISLAKGGEVTRQFFCYSTGLFNMLEMTAVF